LYWQTAAREVAGKLTVDTSGEDPKIGVLRLILSFSKAVFFESLGCEKIVFLVEKCSRDRELGSVSWNYWS
jgi:hypothetical protein